MIHGGDAVAELKRGVTVPTDEERWAGDPRWRCRGRIEAPVRGHWIVSALLGQVIHGGDAVAELKQRALARKAVARMAVIHGGDAVAELKLSGPSGPGGSVLA